MPEKITCYFLLSHGQRVRQVNKTPLERRKAIKVGGIIFKFKYFAALIINDEIIGVYYVQQDNGIRLARD